MFENCPHCKKVINFSEDQLCKAKETLAKMPEGKNLKFKCPACKNLIDLKPEMLAQQLPKTVTPIHPNDKANDQNGLPAYEYKTIYIPVDSVHNNEFLAESFDISPLQKLGQSGWDIVAVVPKTYSQTFCNEMDAAFSKNLIYGAGCGGSIMGVHIILKRCLV